MSNNSTNYTDYKTELEKNGIIAFVPGGNSMWPTLKNRGQSIIVELKTDKLKKFDVAFYQRQSGAFVLHRVIEPTENGYNIIGDSQFEIESVKEEQVFGVMTGFYREKKYIEVTDQKYIEEVEKWFKRKRWRRFRLRIFHFTRRVKNRLKRIFFRKEVK